MKEKEIKEMVREGYAKIAKQESSCCAPISSCCGGTNLKETISKNIGYTDKELAMVPDGVNLGLGCGNPIALASLKEGEVVLDLGSGAGFDCFLAAKAVGGRGHVIGIDMTPEMIDKACENARKGDYQNVEFRLGEIETIPVADNSVDIILSNCVINLSPDKRKVFQEAFRVLKPGGRLMISDLVLVKDLPEIIKNSIEAYIGCLSGAILKERYIDLIKGSGFNEVKIIEENNFPIDCMLNDATAQAVIKNLHVSLEELKEIENCVLSVKVSGIKSN